MARDALDNLVNNIPDWLKRLDDLSGQIDRRQAELAALNAQQPRSACARSLRNKGSAESLKPKDDGPVHIDFQVALPPNGDEHGLQSYVSVTAQADQVLPTSPESANRLALHRKAREAVEAAHSRALAQNKKKRRSSSMVSAEGASLSYRTRSMIIVYYDSYVQGFFDELVRFISSSRNLLRKARMAAKVAQIKRMAELEMRDYDDGTGNDKTPSDSLPSLRYMSTRRLGVMSGMRRSDLGGTNGDDQPPDIFENLDKSLEFVQSTCEHGAHQFLRHADCNDEIKKIQARMSEVVAMAAKELKDRVQRGEVDTIKESGDVERARTLRPVSFRKEMDLGIKADVDSQKESNACVEATRMDHAARCNVVEALNPLEPDPSVDADEGNRCHATDSAISVNTVYANPCRLSNSSLLLPHRCRRLYSSRHRHR